MLVLAQINKLKLIAGPRDGEEIDYKINKIPEIFSEDIALWFHGKSAYILAAVDYNEGVAYYEHIAYLFDENATSFKELDGSNNSSENSRIDRLESYREEMDGRANE